VLLLNQHYKPVPHLQDLPKQNVDFFSLAYVQLDSDIRMKKGFGKNWEFRASFYILRDFTFYSSTMQICFFYSLYLYFWCRPYKDDNDVAKATKRALLT